MITITCLCSFAFSAPSLPPKRADQFSGAFIQYWNDMVTDKATRLKREEWDKVLQDMKNVGMKTIIIQHLGWKDRGREPIYFIGEEADDATETILDLAAEKGMQVWIGLIEESPTDWAEATFMQAHLVEMAKKNILLAKRVWHRYGRDSKGKPRETFFGWYIPLEPWNFAEKEGEDRSGWLNTFFKDISGVCKGLSKDAPNAKQVAMCVYFNPKPPNAPAAKVASAYKKVLHNSRIDVFMVQDGVGARGWKEMAKHIPDYMKAYQEACDAHAIQFWGNLECYAAPGMPTTMEVLQKQFAAAKPPDGKDRRFVTWDFFHYMNPEFYGAQRKICKGQPDRARKDLYDAYKSKAGPFPAQKEK